MDNCCKGSLGLALQRDLFNSSISSDREFHLNSNKANAAPDVLGAAW
jgi:hypothetical protein